MGTVKDATSGLPVLAVIVSIPGTPYRTSTDTVGRYTLRNVPMGNQTIDARRIGYSQARAENVQVNRAVFTHDIVMNPAALTLAAVTTSATVDPTSGTRSPFAVSLVTTEKMPVPAVGATMAIQGKVPGVQVTRSSGSTNGEEPWLQIRSVQSPSNRGSSPLIIVDGVPLNMVRQINSGTSVSTSGGVGSVSGAGDALPVRSADIEGLDIESIEVIKGAAAAALYGSQAASGVISIKTRRGIDVGLNRSQVEARVDFGFDQIANMPKQRTAHQFLVNGAGQWVNSSGQVVTRANRVVDPDLMQDNPFARTYDPVGQVFQPNQSLNSTVRISQMTAASNFHISFTQTRQPGTMRLAEGSTNQTLRLNVDHRPRDNVQVSVGANLNRNVNVPTAANFVTLFGFDPDVNLLAPGTEFGTKYRVIPDSALPTTLNPLHQQVITDNTTKRTAGQLGVNVSYRPTNWLTWVGNAGYNRQEANINVWTPPGLPSDQAGGTTTGSLGITEQLSDGFAAYTSATLLKEFGALTTRFTGQVESSRRKFLQFQATATEFPVTGAQTLGAATNRTTSSVATEARLNSGFGSIALDYDGRYIGDFLFRREGSSLYGPLARYNNFQRAAGSWIASKEYWWPNALRDLTLAKLRYSYGSSGTEPDFQDQFEAVSVTTTGFVRGRLGNRNLLPEKKYEHEMGADFIWKDRVSLSLTYARAVTEGGIVEVEAPNVTGFNTYTKNAGRAHGDAYELTVEGEVMRKGGFGWSMTLNLDRARSVVDTYGRSCYNETPQFVRICNNVPITEYWGAVVMRSKDQLAPSRRKTLDAWDTNDEGYLVPVGAGNRWYEGMKKKLWGTQVIIDGATYNWGVPQPAFSDSTKGDLYAPIGDWAPTFNFGYANKFTYKNFQVYALFSGTVGGDIMNGYREWMEQNLDSPVADQRNRPDSLKKPYIYYQYLPGGGKTTGMTGAGGGTSTRNNDQYVDSQTFLKLAELQFTYTLNSKQYPLVKRLGAERITLELNGTNLLRFDGGYSGLDQEGFFTLSNQSRIRFDGMRYPLARRITTAVSLIF